MSDFREEEKLGKVYDAQLTRRLIKYLRPYRRQVAWAVSFTLGVAALEIVGPYLFHIGVDYYIIPGFAHTIARPDSSPRASGDCGRRLPASLVASFALQYIQVRIMQWVGQETMYDLRKEIFEHLQRLPLSFFDRSPVGRLVTRSTTDVDALNDLFASGVVAMLNDFVQLFGMACRSLQMACSVSARNPFPTAVYDRAHLFFQEPCARGQPPDSHGHRED